MNARGFSLVELMIATLVLLAVSGAAAALTVSMRDTFERTLTAGDAVTRNRSALEMLTTDLRQAGTGLADVDAVAIPHESLGQQGPSAPFTALSVRRVAQHAASGILRQAIAAGAGSLQLEDSVACAGIDRSCGFTAGTAAAIYDHSRLENVQVTAVIESDSRLILTRPISTSFAAGASVVAVGTTTYGLREADNVLRLVRITSGGAEQTVIDHVVHLEFNFHGVPAPPLPTADDEQPPTYGPQPPRVAVDDERDVWPAGENCTITINAAGERVPRLGTVSVAGALFLLDGAALQDGPWCPDSSASSRFDADLLRIRAVGLRITLEVASAQLRGPASRLFGRGGTGTRATQWVSDLDINAVVSLRSRQ